MANDFKRMWTEGEIGSNQFLQRRLDKPSAEWNSETSQTDLKSWLEEKLPSMYVGQVVHIHTNTDMPNAFYIVMDIADNYVELSTIGVCVGRNEIVTGIVCNLSEEKFYIYENDGSDYSVTLLDTTTFKLF